MIWSSPPSTVEQSTSPASTGGAPIPSTVSSPYWSSATTWSSNASSASSQSPSPAVSEESAAHLLLNLGVATGHDNTSTIGGQMPGLRPISGQQQSPVSSGVGNGGGAGGQPSFHVPLNMERLWAGDLSQLPAAATHQMHALNLTANTGTGWPIANSNGDNKPAPVNTYHQMEEPDEQDQPMVCMICDDRATGLHYGIITCEG